MSDEITAETLTDEQIVEAIRDKGFSTSLIDAWFATSDEPESARKHEARARIAAAINARRGAKP